MWFQSCDLKGSTPIFHIGSTQNSLQSDIFLSRLGIFIFQITVAYFLYIMPDMSLPLQK